VFEIEGVGGDRAWEKLAVDSFAEDTDRAPAAVGSKGFSEALDR
jgi:hypothetical protein